MSSEFTQYYEQYKKPIFNYILYRAGFDRAYAEDLTAEIFLKAYEHFDSYDRSRPFKAWIYTIAHNHLINARMAKKETLPLDEKLEIVKEDINDDYGRNIDRKMMIEKIMSLVLLLPATQQELIIMRYINDMSNKETAEILEKEEGAVRTALSRAIAALREEYNKKYL